MMRLVEFVGCDRMNLADDCAAESRPQFGLLVTSPMCGYALIGVLALSAMVAPTASAWVAALTHDRSKTGLMRPGQLVWLLVRKLLTANHP